MLRTLPLSLLAALLAPACLSPAPGVDPPPDSELRNNLELLREVRGGAFDGTSNESESEVVRELQTLAFKYPRHTQILIANAAVAYDGGDPVMAQKYLDQALEVDPGHVSATLLRVRIAAEEGSLQYARRRLDDQLQLAPDVPELREAYAGVLYLLSEYDEAEDELDVAEHLVGPEGESGWRIAYHRGLIAEARGDRRLAEEHYQRCAELNPDFERGARRWRWIQSSNETEAEGARSDEPLLDPVPMGSD